jgi:hypothetical protein
MQRSMLPSAGSIQQHLLSCSKPWIQHEMCISPTWFFGIHIDLNMPRNIHCIVSLPGIECWVIKHSMTYKACSNSTVSCMFQCIWRFMLFSGAAILALHFPVLRTAVVYGTVESCISWSYSCRVWRWRGSMGLYLFPNFGLWFSVVITGDPWG